MRSLFMLFILFAAVMLIAAPLSAQTTQTDPSITSTRAIGEVKSIDAAKKQLVIKTDAGSMIIVVLSDTTTYSRLAPGETTLANATAITMADIGEGDRILATGKTSEDFKSIPSRRVVVMTKADIAKKQEKERLEWRQRGILGVIAAIKPDTKEVTISTRSGAGTQPVIIPISEKVDMRRYAPDSIKFSDAKPSEFTELKLGDQVRALGDKSTDGTHFTPEKVVTGAFRTVAGTVTAIDSATGEVKVNDLEKKQPLTIVIKTDSVLRRFPAEFGGRGPAAGGQGAPAGAGANASRPAGAAPANGGGSQGAGMRPNIADMLERLPTISMADLKVGDTIIVSSTKGSDPTRLTAITLVSGAETLLAMLAPRPQPGAAQTPNPAAGLGSGVSFGIGLP
ncbi:MAG TPA: hypothetical protein VGN86_15730 [Pyrinomonadaceae bacterium]|nr:hypothetical protein [Pyrinomonadaceae bacterium]